jgi:nicotinate dehydrogenase subunit B
MTSGPYPPPSSDPSMLREKTSSAYLEADDILLVTRPGSGNQPDIYLALTGDGAVIAFNGHVDLGTGIRTALAQIVAEELDVAFERVTMVLGTTSAAPDQGPTIASETIQITANPLRLAAASARRHLLAAAADHLGSSLEDLSVEAGLVGNGQNTVSYGDLVRGRHCRIEIDPTAPAKPVDQYRIVGKPQARNDIAAKTLGDWTYVHDVRVPGMLHGRVIRPPYVGYDHGENVGNSLIAVDETSVAGIEGLVAVVAIGDFVGVVATREEFAAEAARRLKVQWKLPPARPDLNDVETALKNNPGKKRLLKDDGDVERALLGASPLMQRTYVWPYQMHGSIGPSCAVADWTPEKLVVWSGTQNPHFMRRDLSRLMDMPEETIVVERYEAAGCYGRNCADDVTADAALLSRATGRPVRVQLTREQEHGWEPKGAGQVIDVRGGLDLEGGPIAYDFETRYPSNLSPTLALILTGKVAAVPDVTEMGDRTAIPPYAVSHMRIAVHDMPPIARASWFRGVSAMPNSFAHESFFDELAAAAGVDPVEYRLRYLTDPRGADLVRAVTEKAGWKPRTRFGTEGGEGDLLYGRGFAYALYVHGKFPGTPAAWSAWVADVAVNRRTGEVSVTRVTVGQDTGLMINPDGVRHQIHGNVIQSVSRVLKEEVRFTQTGIESLEWGGYPILTFEETPDIDVLMIPRPDEEPRGAGESASVPSAAAIVNAVYDATGLRFRELPLTPERVLAGLQGRQKLEHRQEARTKRKRWLRLGGFGLLGVTGFAGLAAGSLAVMSPWRPVIEAIRRPDPALFGAASVERGRLVAAAGGCATCHADEEGPALAGGRRFDTPFGTVVAPNISPDERHGIGGWSYPAFVRAIRDGIGRDGSHLYPVHPYTSFTHVSDGDLQDLYAYLMNTPAAPSPSQPSSLRFPFNNRSLMAGWNTLYLNRTTIDYAPDKGEAWNRGAYLVEGLGHCSACHSPRNALGAEETGKAHLAGGFADGWQAPAINGASPGPIGWTADALYDYLRTGHSADHGSAAGPMALVVRQLSDLPDADIQAMATYLASLQPPAGAAPTVTRADVIAASEAAAPQAALAFPEGARLFEGACSACHDGKSHLAHLSLNSTLHGATPDNLMQAVLDGVEAPASLRARPDADMEVMSMPSFRDSFGDRQLGELAAYLRARFAPAKPAWPQASASAASIRGSAPIH